MRMTTSKARSHEFTSLWLLIIIAGDDDDDNNSDGNNNSEGM